VRLYGVIWKEKFAIKIAQKHHVNMDEVEQALLSNPIVRFAEKGCIKGENLYLAYGRTLVGRYIVIFFVKKHRNTAMPISARDMSASERRYYNAQKESS